MFNWFKNTLKAPAGLIGLDIGTVAIKLTQFRLINGNHQLVHYAVAPLPPSVKDMTAITTLLTQMFVDLPQLPRNVAIAVHDDQVISKVIQLDAGLTESEIETHVMLEADQYIPYPIDEINLDFQVQGKALQHPGMIDVLLVAARKDTVSARINAISAAGLTVKVVDVESYAINRAISQLVLCVVDKQSVVAVLDVGVAMIRLIILQNGHRIFARSETLILSESNPITVEIVLPKLQRMLQLFFSSHQCDKIHKLFLAGGMALFQGLENGIAEALGVKVSLVNPFLSVVVAESIDKDALEKIAPSLLLSCGLGLRYFAV